MSSYTTLMMIVLATILATTMAANNSSNGTGVGMASFQQNPVILLTLALVPIVARIFA
jgi:fumarate reductase subunit C